MPPALHFNTTASHHPHSKSSNHLDFPALQTTKIIKIPSSCHDTGNQLWKADAHVAALGIYPPTWAPWNQIRNCGSIHVGPRC